MIKSLRPSSPSALPSLLAAVETQHFNIIITRLYINFGVAVTSFLKIPVTVSRKVTCTGKHFDLSCRLQHVLDVFVNNQLDALFQYMYLFISLLYMFRAGWRPTTLVVPNVKKIRDLNLPGTPWATSACCGRPLPFLHVSSNPVLIIRRINCINTSSGIYHSV